MSADYCQLELRLLAHLAKDSILCSILNSGSDVFRRIASTWNHTSVSDVSILNYMHNCVTRDD
jgi:DNA polymerase I-like protein with 3'-5' exonuclease and polymerase domains